MINKGNDKVNVKNTNFFNNNTDGVQETNQPTPIFVSINKRRK
jgi:hypothetical protein